MARKFLDSLEESELKEITFKLFSPEQIRSRSVVEINLAQTYNDSGYAIPHGVMDARLGVIQPGQICETCNGDYVSCSGHTGHIELADPVVYIEYVDTILKTLNKVCLDCSVLLDGPICSKCNYTHTTITLQKPNIFMINNEILSVYKVREVLEKISDYDLNKLKINTRLEWAVLTVMPVPSVKTRPSIFLETGKKSEDDLTHKLIDIVKISQKLKKLKEAVQISAIYGNLYSLLNYHVVTYFNNTIAGIPVAVSRNNKLVKSLVERIKGKTGRFRNNLAGKRINYVARSVITPAPTIPINYILLPKSFAEQLTKPILVNESNLEQIRKLILSYPIYPCVLYIINEYNTRLKILEINKQILCEQLKPGYKVERQLIDEDYVLVNRQPTLHKLSIQAHKIKVSNQKTIGLHPCACTPYNADFDGDEMNIHVPQDPIAETEAILLMSVEKNILAPRNGKPAMGALADVLSGAYLLSTDQKFSKSEVSYITQNLNIKLPDFENVISGKDILSTLFEKDFDFIIKHKNNELIIEKGKILTGRLDKSFIGPSGSLFDRYAKRYGQDKTAKLLDNLTLLSLNLFKIYGLTYSFEDNQIDDNLKNKINALIKETEMKLSNTDKITKQKLLNELRDEAGKLATLRKQNPVLIMAKAGSAGSQLNYIQVTATVGLQSFSDKRNTNAYGKDKAYPLEINNLLEKNNYIKSNYSQGLNSFEFFEQACAARDSEIDVYIKTATSGYLQRRLINCLNDVFVSTDNSVLDSYNKIIQFKCGSDDLDFRKIDKTNPIVDLDLLGILPSNKLNNKEISKQQIEEFVSRFSEKLKQLPIMFLQGIAHFCIMYNYTSQDIIDIEDKIINLPSKYSYDSFEPIGIVAAQSIGEPATQMTLKSKHVSGIAELRLTTGLERLIELLNATQNLKTPSMTFLVKDPTKKEEVVNKIVMFTISNLYNLFVKLDEFTITLEEKEKIKPNLTEVYNLIKSKINNIKLSEIDSKIIITSKVQTYHQLYKIYNSLCNLKVYGITRLENVIITKLSSGYKIVTQGSNLKEAKMVFDGCPYVDYESNDVDEILSIFGLETARFYLVKEILNVLKKQGLDVSITHIELVADLMTVTGKMLPMGRTGVIKYKQSTIAKAAFETAISFIMDASLKGQTDKLQGVFENALLGKNVNIGTERIKLRFNDSPRTDKE